MSKKILPSGITVDFEKVSSNLYATLYLTGYPDMPLVRLTREPLIGVKPVTDWAEQLGKKYGLSNIKSKEDWDSLEKQTKDKIQKALTSSQTLYRSMKGADSGMYGLDKYEGFVREARKVTDKIVSAFLSGGTARQANTHTDGNSLFLHNNEIAKMKNGDLWITNAGWASRTTYERLNGLPGVSVSVKQGKTYLNGVPWDGNWINVGKASTMESRMIKRSSIKTEARNVIRRIIKEEVVRALRIKKSLKEAVRGLNLEQPHSNLYIKGWGNDVNGNNIIIVGFPNDKGFSIQTNGNLPETNRALKYAHKELSDDELDVIGKEITDYASKYASKDVKSRLRKYGVSKTESRLRTRRKNSLKENTTVDTQTLQQYIATALWSTTDGDSGNLDDEYGFDDLAPQTLKKAKQDLEEFFEKASSYLEGLDPTDVAHDFWLSRNDHGAGFWDGDYEEGVGEELDKIATSFKEQDWYAGDDGKIYISGAE